MYLKNELLSDSVTECRNNLLSPNCVNYKGLNRRQQKINLNRGKYYALKKGVKHLAHNPKRYAEEEANLLRIKNRNNLITYILLFFSVIFILVIIFFK